MDVERLATKSCLSVETFIVRGGDMTIEAFKILRERMPEAEIYVAGPASDPYQNEQVPGYHYMGDCDRLQLAELYNKCDIFCMPSYFEAYGLVFIEALTFGLPCIGRNCYEMPYFIEDGETGYLLKDDNTEAYANKMYSLLHNSKIRAEVESRRGDYIHEYSWETVAERLLEYMC